MCVYHTGTHQCVLAKSKYKREFKFYNIVVPQSDTNDWLRICIKHVYLLIFLSLFERNFHGRQSNGWRFAKRKICRRLLRIKLIYIKVVYNDFEETCKNGNRINKCVSFIIPYCYQGRLTGCQK